jgi:pimeloyl-ACP methyl ester carboxylesterase
LIMGWHRFQRSGGSLWGVDEGIGYPVVFQHGLGGDEAQVGEVFPSVAGVRRLTLDCRAQGRSDRFESAPYSIELFADDVLAFVDSRGLSHFAVGGISMGAAIALRLAVRAPDRVAALILARPAWLWDAAPGNMRPFREVAACLTAAEAPEAKRVFQQSATARQLATDAPDNLTSLLGFFDRPNPDVTSRLLTSISEDGPGITRGEIERLGVPTLVIATGRDHVHPLEYGRTLAGIIKGARFVEIEAKATNRKLYVDQFRNALDEFFARVTGARGFQRAAGVNQ